MDSRTLRVYEEQAETTFARHTTGNRLDQFGRLLEWLLPDEPTADIGSGSGVVLAWLAAQGFPAVGYEPVEALRRLSVASYPDLDLRSSALPMLEGVPDSAYGNVVCSAVLMHVPLNSIPPSIANLARILRPGGRLLLSWRAGKDGVEREEDGRLFTPIASDLLNRSLAEAGLYVLRLSANEDKSRPGVIWHEVVAEKATVT